MNARLAALAALVVDLAVTAVLWPRLPEQVPVHWNLAGEADRLGSKWELLAFGPVLMVVLGVVLVVLRRVDPRASTPLPPDAPPAEGGSREAVIAVVGWLLACVHVAAMLQAIGSPLGGPVLMGLGFAAFQVLLGNAMPRLRPNFYVGVRTAWTLSSDTVWRRTHRLAGKLLVGSGLASLLAVALAPSTVAFPFTVVAMLVALVAPVVASYVFWRGERRAG